MTNGTSAHFTKELLAELIADTGIGYWLWDFASDSLVFDTQFYHVVGHEPGAFKNYFSEWKEIVHQDDINRLVQELNDFRKGAVASHISEFRIISQTGEIIWVQERGCFIQHDADGVPQQMAAIIQNITVRKEMEQRLREKQHKLKLAMSCSGLAVWEWDIVNNVTTFSSEYANMLGYTEKELDISASEWAKLVHPDDFPLMKEIVGQYINGEISNYRMKLRVKKADNSYMWVNDIGEVMERDEDGKPTKLIGGRLDIDELEHATIQLEHYQDDLENEIHQRTEALIRQDTLLMEITKISQKLMTTPKGDGFNEVVFNCMDEITSVSDSSRLCIFRNKPNAGKPHCYLANHRKNHSNVYRTEFTIDEIRKQFQGVDIGFASNGAFTEETKEAFFEVLQNLASIIDLSNIDYLESLPTFYQALQDNHVLNMKTTKLSPNEFIFMQLQGIRSVLLSPITINNESWGFIVMDDPSERMFSLEEEKMISLAGSVFAQAIHQNETELATREAIEHGKLMLDATPICCNLWLADGTNIDCSNESVRLFELSSQQEYLDCFDFLSPEFQPCGRKSEELRKEMVQIARETGHHRFEWLHQKLNGEPIPCEITLVRIKHKDSYAVAGYTRDLRELKAMLAELEEKQEHLRLAHEEAVLSSKAKSNFLANMSHEIRTPMNAISGMTDIILRETDKTEVGEYAHNIKRACDSLLAIINDVLDISKIESGKLDIVEGEYELSSILNDVINIANARLELKSLMFVTDFQHDLPDKLIGDEVRVKQVMVNILNNAIKFTHEGHVKLDVSGKYGDGELELCIKISDTGTGIAPEDLEKLFIEFERVNTTKNRTIEGTGLGLAISKRLCEMMEGTITVESTEGEGSTFSIIVKQKYNEYTPLAKVEETKSVLIFEARDVYRNSMELACEQLKVPNVCCSLQSELNEALNEKKFDYVFTSCMYLSKVEEMIEKLKLTSKIVLLADTAEIKAKYDFTSIVLPANSLAISNVLNGKTFKNTDEADFINFIAPSCHILVVDDNLVNLKVAKGLMKPYQFEISTAENGKIAVEMIKENKYDMVFMDHMMPIMDGIDATIAVRALEDEYFKTLPIVALTANAIIGTREMFIKEGMNDFLAKPIKLTTLHEILAKWLPKEKQIQGADEAENPQETAQISEKSITIHCVDTALGVQRVGGDFDTYIDILDMYYKDGVKRASSIQSLFKEKQLKDYKIEVHALKSASASIGAVGLSERARALEEAATQEDWVFIDHNTGEFLDDFNIILENIRNALKPFSHEEDHSGKEMGEPAMFADTLAKLEEALDIVDITECDNLIQQLFEFNWNQEQLGQISQIKDFIAGYEYDEAVELIQQILA